MDNDKLFDQKPNSRGRAARVKVETIFENLKDLPIFDNNGSIKTRKDPVWQEAIRRMPEINLHNLYIFVCQDRRDIKTALMKYKKIDTAPLSKVKKKNKKEVTSHYNERWDDYDYYETLDQENDTETNNDFDILLTIKDSDQYKNTIQKVGVLPFSVIYWHPHQINLWSDLIHLESTVSLIVINNVIKNLKGSFESGNIYLYALAVKLNSTIILLGQMMSDSANSLEIQYFIDSWLQGGGLAPTEFVTGYSYSLLDAASLSFNFCSFDQYNLRCFRYLLDENVGLPPTMLQIDIIGLIKVVNGWACFENIAQAVKDFYLCSIMYLSVIDNIVEFKEAVISILALCQSPYQNDEIETRRITLWANLTSETIQQMNQQYIQLVTGKNGTRSFSFYNNQQSPVISETPHDIFEYVNQLKQKAFDLCNFNTSDIEISNDYYCPIILENLIQLLIEFPSWTKIFVKKKECSTLVSNCSIKHLSTLTELKDSVNPPQFLMYHYEKINSLMHQGRFIINKMKNKIGIVEKEYKNNHTHLTQMTIVSKDALQDSRIEINVPAEEESNLNDCMEISEIPVQTERASVLQRKVPEEHAAESDELDLLDFKSAVNTVVQSLHDFDEYYKNVLLPLIKPGQEGAVCKTLFDCCTEMKTYEKFLGDIAEKFCKKSGVFKSSFKTIFIEFYNTIELLEKKELENASKFFAHLLKLNALPWESLIVVKLKDASNQKKNFLRILLRQLSDHMGIDSLENKFREEEYKSAFKGLFPMESKTDTVNAMAFYRSIGLQALGNILKGSKKMAAPQKFVANASEQRYSQNVSGAESDDSCDFVFELRVKKKNGKRCSSSQRTQVSL